MHSLFLSWHFDKQYSVFSFGSLKRSGGEKGIRTPEGLLLNGFQDRRIRPLCHLSLVLYCTLENQFLIHIEFVFNEIKRPKHSF